MILVKEDVDTFSLLGPYFQEGSMESVHYPQNEMDRDWNQTSACIRYRTKITWIGSLFTLRSMCIMNLYLFRPRTTLAYG